jgi:hypothetical protein
VQPKTQGQYQVGAKALAKARVSIGEGTILRRPPGTLARSKIEYLECFHHLIEALSISADVLHWSGPDGSGDRAEVLHTPKPFPTRRAHQRIEGQPPKYLDAPVALKTGR